MVTFPTFLKTGAVAQYPLKSAVSLATQAVQFLDGSRQTYQLSGAGLRRWELNLDMLDEAEVSAVIAFSEQVGSDAFSFTNPATGETSVKCVFSGERITTSLVDELHGAVTIGIEEVI